MRHLLRPEAGFFLLVWVGVLVGFRERAFLDPGSLWHVRVGEIILADGFPRTDPFTFPFAGRPWVPQQWAAEVVMAGVHRAAGLDGLLLALATLVAAVYTFVFARAVRAGVGWPLAGLMVGGALVVGGFHFCARPHMATVALLAWTMAVVVDWDRGRCGPWRLAGLIPLFVLWTNLHGGVLAGVLTLGLGVWGRGPDGATAKRGFTALVSVTCALTPFVNPFGLDLLDTWRRIMLSAELPRLVHEHMPLDPATPAGLAVLGLGAFYLFALAGTLPARPRLPWLIPLVWLALSLKGIRHGPLFAVTAAVALADLWPHTIWHRMLKEHGDGTLAAEPDAHPRRAWVLGPVLAVTAAAGLLLAGHGRGWARLDPDVVPTDLTAEMTAYAASVPPGTPVFNDANLGGYLITHTPTLKVFMDDRFELCGDAWLRRYADAMTGSPADAGAAFERWAAEYGFTRALVVTAGEGEERPPLEQYLSAASDRWREVARGRRAAVFDRVRP